MSDKPGIRARRVRAENVVDGIQLQGDVVDARHLLLLAKEISTGGITVDEIEARNLVTGLQVVTRPTMATVSDLGRELTLLRPMIQSLSERADPEDTGRLSAVAAAVDTANNGLAAGNISGKDIVPVLQNAAETVTQVADTVDATGRVLDGIGKVAAALATLGAIAARLFGMA